MVGPDLPGGSGFWGRVAEASQEGRVPLGCVAGTSQEGPVPWAMVQELPRRVRFPGLWGHNHNLQGGSHSLGPGPWGRSLPGGSVGPEASHEEGPVPWALGRVVALGWLRIYEGAAFS